MMQHRNDPKSAAAVVDDPSASTSAILQARNYAANLVLAGDNDGSSCLSRRPSDMSSTELSDNVTRSSLQARQCAANLVLQLDNSDDDDDDDLKKKQKANRGSKQQQDTMEKPRRMQQLKRRRQTIRTSATMRHYLPTSIVFQRQNSDPTTLEEMSLRHWEMSLLSMEESQQSEELHNDDDDNCLPLVPPDQYRKQRHSDKDIDSRDPLLPGAYPTARRERRRQDSDRRQPRNQLLLSEGVHGLQPPRRTSSLEEYSLPPHRNLSQATHYLDLSDRHSARSLALRGAFLDSMTPRPSLERQGNQRRLHFSEPQDETTNTANINTRFLFVNEYGNLSLPRRHSLSDPTSMNASVHRFQSLVMDQSQMEEHSQREHSYTFQATPPELRPVVTPLSDKPTAARQQPPSKATHAAKRMLQNLSRATKEVSKEVAFLLS